MTAPTHIIIGIACYYAIKDPVLAVPMAILTHPLLDNACVYHPDKLLKVDSVGKAILLGVGLCSLSILLFLVKTNLNAYVYGVVFAWLGCDIQWLARYLWDRDVLPIHQWFSRCYRSDKWKFIIIELIIMVYGLFVIWRNLY